MDSKLSYQSKYVGSWALIIGINQYKHSSPLGYATNDAEAIATVLEDRFGFPKANISLLLDDDATRENIMAAFMSFTSATKLEDDDRLLVFFAGHGHTASGKRGEVGFLVPVDGTPQELKTLVRWDELTRNADLIPAKHLFFLMDACYGGLALVRSPAFGSMRFLGDMLKRYARQVLTAGKADETVADGDGVRPGHSIFTAHLLDALEGAAATEEGVITASAVMAYVYDRVARDQYSHQTPHYGFVDGDGDFVFDTSVLDTLRATESDSPTGADEDRDAIGEKDILINTSPEISTVPETEPPIVDKMKDLLSDPTKRIKLDDFVTHQIRRFLDSTDLRHFPIQGAPVNNEEFEKRIHNYEQLTQDLQQIVILLAKWGDKDQLLLLERIVIRLAEADKGSDGKVLWLRLTWYPMLVLMYIVGIVALATRKYEVLRIALQTTVQVDGTRSNERLPVVVPVVEDLTEIVESFKWLPGHERRYAPRSEHLFTTLQPVLEDLLFLGRSYESHFDEFEILLALTYSDATERNWGPPGRFGWKHTRGYDSPFDRLVADATKAGEKWGPLQAGLFGGSPDRLQKNVVAIRELLGKLHWF